MNSRSITALSLVLMCHSAVALNGLGDELLPRSPRSLEQPRSGPYCGINAIYAASRHFGKTFTYSELFDPRFVGSVQGSNLAELSAAAEFAELPAIPRSGMTVRDLRSLEVPSILLLSRHRDSASFYHWVLVLHAAPDHIRIMEAPGSEEDISYAQLMAQWDGVALVVYADQAASDAAESKNAIWNYLLSFAAAVIAVCAFASRKWLPLSLTSPSFRPTGAALRAGAILGVGITGGLLWHYLAPTGFARNSDATAIVKTRFFSRRLPHVTCTQLEELISCRSAVVIDARMERDYQAGHIPTALNVPVYVSPTALQEFARTLPKEKAVVVYCQSDKCEYDDQIGSQLYLTGVRNLSLFHGGWKEWKERKHSASSASTTSGESKVTQ
jgi:rhodanese-related sulfurtransferase